MLRRHVLPLIALASLTVTSCTGNDNAGDAGDPATTTTTPSVTGSTAPPSPAELTVVGPVEGTPQTSGGAALDEAGYVEEEYFVSGSAVRFEPESTLSDDGRWSVTEGDEAPFTTRILVKRPAAPDDASGVVVVEWNNVSAGSDGTPDWTYTSAELLRSGHVHVAVSAQKAGVDADAGGGIGGFGTPLTAADPDRYGDLSHPGDPFSYDMFRLVGRLVRGGAADGPDPFDGVPVDHVLAIGESQSAFRLTTYVNAVQPLDPVFDGFLVHSRGGGAAPLGEAEGLTSSIEGAVRIRDDLTTPTLVFTTETDLTVLGYSRARQPDTDSVVGWEVAGTAHADAFILGGDPAVGAALGCPVPVNDGPQHVALKAALATLVDWVRTGDDPPRGERIAFDEAGAIERDDDGLAIGGIRLPSVEVPFAALSGDPPPDASPICSLFGTTDAFGPEEMAARHGSSEDYVAAVDAAFDDAVADGFALEADRRSVLDEAAGVPFP